MRQPVMLWLGDVVKQRRPEAPVLEVGARNENGSARLLFPQDGYVAMDKAPGPGVDLIMDVLNAGDTLRRRFETVLATEVLEHVTEPWRAIEIMYDALVPGGLFVASWCFAFPIHAAPEDYWRITPSGFELLLRRVGFIHIGIVTEGCGRPANAPRTEADWQYPVGVFAVARRPADAAPDQVVPAVRADPRLRNPIEKGGPDHVPAGALIGAGARQ